MNSLIPGSNLYPNFINNRNLLINLIDLDYDTSMKSRWTTSFGRSYNYSDMSYPDTDIPDFLLDLIPSISNLIGFVPNNCLINLYHDGNSSMGYHSDNTDILFDGTGVAILSIGSTRILRFRNILDTDNIIDYILESGSLFYMNDYIQSEWMHSIPRMDADSVRISLTFRKIK